MSEIDTNTKTKKKLGKRDVIEVLVIFGVMFIIFQFILISVKVDGISMYPTLINSERGIMVRTSPINKPTYGNIVVVDGTNTYGKNEGFVVKRIFAMGNDTIEIKDNQIFVNDKKVDDSFCNMDTLMKDMAKLRLKEDEVFIIGDNRNSSKDSREVGPVKYDDIKAVNGIMYWPINKIGLIR